jgi:hypothetical protein
VAQSSNPSTAKNKYKTPRCCPEREEREREREREKRGEREREEREREEKEKREKRKRKEEKPVRVGPWVSDQLITFCIVFPTPI